MSEQFRPFANEVAVLTIDNLLIENRFDRVILVGDMDITFDVVGLERAGQLKALLDKVIARLEGEKSLPGMVELAPSESVKNPFLE